MDQQKLLDSAKAHIKLMADRNHDGKVDFADVEHVIEHMKATATTTDKAVRDAGARSPWLLVAVSSMCTSGLWYLAWLIVK